MISLMGFIMSSKLVTSQDLQFSFSQGLYSDWMTNSLDDDEDDDSPIIRGFADDEPLVVS